MIFIEGSLEALMSRSSDYCTDHRGAIPACAPPRPRIGVPTVYRKLSGQQAGVLVLELAHAVTAFGVDR